MKRVFYMLFIGAFAASVAACSSNPSETSADSSKPSGFFDRLKPEPKITVPAGTRLRVALVEGVSTTKNSPGDRFTATLAEPVIVDGKMVLEKGTKVRGSVVDVKESGRVKGRASIQLTLNEIVRDGKSLPISTKPFIAVAESTKKRDAAMIGGGGKGAAVGAAIGGGAGTGTVLATKGKEIHYGPETRLSFTLSNSMEI